MRHLVVKRSLILAASMLACTACVSTDNLVFGTDSDARTEYPAISQGQYGTDFAVRATIGAIKSNGGQGHVSSRAIRLPERPLGEIVVYDYQFPRSCGGHEFRVFETAETQILEFQYAPLNGDTHLIRDYVSGTSPFMQPGLWGANDHTAASISTMTSQFEQRGDGMFNGVYSQGLVTGLPTVEQFEYGDAYQQALSDAYRCQETRTLVGSTGE